MLAKEVSCLKALACSEIPTSVVGRGKEVAVECLRCDEYFSFKKAVADLTGFIKPSIGLVVDLHELVLQLHDPARLGLDQTHA